MGDAECVAVFVQISHQSLTHRFKQNNDIFASRI